MHCAVRKHSFSTRVVHDANRATCTRNAPTFFVFVPTPVMRPIAFAAPVSIPIHFLNPRHRRVPPRKTEQKYTDCLYCLICVYTFNSDCTEPAYAMMFYKTLTVKLNKVTDNVQILSWTTQNVPADRCRIATVTGQQWLGDWKKQRLLFRYFGKEPNVIHVRKRDFFFLTVCEKSTGKATRSVFLYCLSG